MRTASDNFLMSWSTDREELSTLHTRVLDLETELQAPRAPPSNLADAMRDWDGYKALLRSLAAQFQGFKLVMPKSYSVLKVLKLLFAMVFALC